MRGVVGGDIFYKLLIKFLSFKFEGRVCVMVFVYRNMLFMVCLFLCVGLCFLWCVYNLFWDLVEWIWENGIENFCFLYSFWWRNERGSGSW